MPYTYEYARPAVTTDVVLFTIRGRQLELLLIERGHPPFEGTWALPGGFVDIDEDLDQCALRELEEETGIAGVYLEQLYTFGEPRRDPRDRVISVAYYALAPTERLHVAAGSDARRAAWHPVGRLPELAFDHAAIVSRAHQRLAAKLNYSTIALQFMGSEFTLSELQAVYETILGEALDKRNFRKRVLAQGMIEETGEFRRQGHHRPARLYRVVHPERVDFLK